MTDWLGMIPGPRPPRGELRAHVLGRAEQGPGRRAAGGTLAAAAMLAMLLAGGGYWTWRTITALRVERDELAAALGAARDTLGFVRSAGTRVVTIPIAKEAGGTVTILADSATRRWLVRCERMAPNAPDQTYQIWFITERGMRHAALMPMDPGQPAVMTMVLAIPGDAGRVTGAAMTIEPRGGSAEPQGPLLFRVEL
jgi:anti-sigma-K factor RskA